MSSLLSVPRRQIEGYLPPYCTNYYALAVVLGSLWNRTYCIRVQRKWGVLADAERFSLLGFGPHFTPSATATKRGLFRKCCSGNRSCGGWYCSNVQYHGKQVKGLANFCMKNRGNVDLCQSLRQRTFRLDVRGQGFSSCATATSSSWPGNRPTEVSPRLTHRARCVYRGRHVCGTPSPRGA